MTSFPDSFLWGAATAAHQTEGNNIGSDWWEMENSSRMHIAERSGDAADSLHRYREDMQLLAERGFDMYRFSIEWARIEPEDGQFSEAMLQHYRRMIETALDLGLTPNVTLHHFTNPRWFAHGGGWHRDDAPEVFLRYATRAAEILSGVEWVVTINEPNMVAVVHDFAAPNQSDEPPAPDAVVTQNLIRAHHLTGAMLRERGHKVGWTIANQAYHAVPGYEAETLAYQYPREDVFLEAARGDDWLGVQAYLRTFIGEGGRPQPLPEGVERTLTGWEYFPEALGIAIRHSADVVGDVPIIVTENGMATSDDQRRIAYTGVALRDVASAIADGIDVRGYLHWSLLDNYEWGSFRPTFGLVAVDPVTFERHPKPSLDWLAGVARTGRVD